VHPKVLPAEGWAAARKLVGAGLTEGWTLAGGTALALQIGHRVSVDLDFFGERAFEPADLALALGRLGRVEVRGRSEGTLHAALDGLRVTFLHAQAALLFPGTPYRGLSLADPRDIAVMKLVAIGGRGSRRDFVDLYFFLRGGGSLEDVFALTRRRFRDVDFNAYHLLRSLAFFDDAESEPMPRLLRIATWADVKKTIQAEVRRLS
jgi:hypothetical protein